MATSTDTPRLRIRMYRHGLGDCFLLRFRKKDGDDTFNILIDCGLIGVAKNPRETMTRVAEDIKAACKDHVDIAVMTHEHWDHASGFSTHQALGILEKLSFDEVWYAWTEDPSNALGQKLSRERAAKVEALAAAAYAFRPRPGFMPDKRGADRAEGLKGMLGFFGIEVAESWDEMLGLSGAGEDGNGKEDDGSGKMAIGKTRRAFHYLKNCDIKTRYCHPADGPRSLPGVEGVQVYVLGPPEDEGLIKKSRPTKKGREVYELASETGFAENLADAFSRLGPHGGDENDDDCPFDASYRTRRHPSGTDDEGSILLRALLLETWDAPGQDWRRIDLEWTQVAETLALNLDNHTNNTCLVLAFEFTDSGDVFLFPADAQVGNWLSWQDLQWSTGAGAASKTVTGPELLSRTVFYKVSHHGSHNATLRSLGLEQMTNDGLVAFIPVNREQALSNRWTGIPFEPLIEELRKKTYGRLVRSDDSTVPDIKDKAGVSETASEKFSRAIEIDADGLYFEYSYA